MGKKNEMKDVILGEAAKGNVVVLTFDGFKVANLDDFIDQPVEGLLYDLNRGREVVLTFLKDPKWVNDYAVCLVITRLKELLEDACKANCKRCLKFRRKAK